MIIQTITTVERIIHVLILQLLVPVMLVLSPQLDFQDLLILLLLLAKFVFMNVIRNYVNQVLECFQSGHVVKPFLKESIPIYPTWLAKADAHTKRVS